MPTSLVVVADGSEEMEAVITIDVLRRGGVDVTVAGLNSADTVTCSRQVMLKPDTSLASVAANQYDAVILPGGMPGAQSFAESAQLGEVLKDQEKRGGIVAAICAAPKAFVSHGIGKDKTVTSHPSMMQHIKDAGFTYSEDRVVIDGKIVTSRGPGTAFEFGLALVELLQGKDKRDELIPPMLLKL